MSYQYYIGVKRVQARPQERDGKEGYEVIYDNGHRSWSPKDVFDAAYLPMNGDGTRIDEDMVSDFVRAVQVSRMGNHAVVMAELRNGTSIVRSSPSVEAERFDQSAGYASAMRKIRTDIWRGLSFMLNCARNGFSRP